MRTQIMRVKVISCDEAETRLRMDSIKQLELNLKTTSAPE